jgi:hypothetical protein
MSFCDLNHILRFIVKWTQNGPDFILYNHQAPHDCGTSRWDWVLAARTVCDT